MTLEEALTVGADEIRRLRHGERVAITGNWCKHCRATDLYLVARLEPTDPQGSLSGTQLKITARYVYVLGCGSCGRESGDGKGGTDDTAGEGA